MTKPDTLEKQRFFALYWGQQVLCWKGLHTTLDECYWIEGRESDIERYLSLYSLSDITDEDAIEVAKIKGWNDVLNEKGNIKAIKDWLFEQEYQYLSETNTLFRCGEMIDYLRSRGYALPFNGRSVEEMIELGWLKIRKR